MSDAPETAAEKLVAQALFGNQQIKGEPDNYYLHRNTFLATVQQAIAAEREACAKVADGWSTNVPFGTTHQDQSYAMGVERTSEGIAEAIRARSEQQ